MVWLTGLGPASAVPAMIAHLRGADDADHHGVQSVVRMGLWAIALLSVPLLLVLTCTRPILMFLGEDPALVDGAGLFMSSLMWGLPVSLGYQVLRNF